MAELIFFIVFALGAIAGALGVLIAKNPVNSAISLVMSFFCLASIYVLLNAVFMGIIQVLVYAGAIMVLFVFVLMLINPREDELVRVRLGPHQMVAVLMGVAMLVLLLQTICTTSFTSTSVVAQTLPAGFGEVEQVGHSLLTTFVLPFELAAVLLLVGIVSAVVVAKKRF